jgi:hypothetical protein
MPGAIRWGIAYHKRNGVRCMDKKIIPVGLDLGNGWVNICIMGKVAKLPAAYAFQRPTGQILPSGLEAKSKAFLLIVGASELWFGLDVLSGPTISELDDTKYDPDHISILFRAALYAWSKRHKMDLGKLSRLGVVASMPPGAFADRQLNKRAERAYKLAFNRGQSHVQIRDGHESIQIVTQFSGLQRESIGAIASIARPNALILIVDIGFGTVDYALFNGGSEPILSKSDNIGLAHAYEQINPANPALAELMVLRSKKTLPNEIKVHFNGIKNRVVMIRRKLRQPIEKIAIIGGGAPLMTSPIRATFGQLTNQLVVKDEYENARANWLAAGGSDAN